MYSFFFPRYNRKLSKICNIVSSGCEKIKSRRVCEEMKALVNIFSNVKQRAVYCLSSINFKIKMGIFPNFPSDPTSFTKLLNRADCNYDSTNVDELPELL